GPGNDPRMPWDLGVEELQGLVELAAIECLVATDRDRRPIVAERAQRLVARAGTPPANRLAVPDGPDVDDLALEHDSAPMAAALLVRDHCDLVARLDQQLGLDVKVVEALHPRGDEVPEPVGAA